MLVEDTEVLVELVDVVNDWVVEVDCEVEVLRLVDDVLVLVLVDMLVDVDDVEVDVDTLVELVDSEVLVEEVLVVKDRVVLVLVLDVLMLVLVDIEVLEDVEEVEVDVLSEVEVELEVLEVLVDCDVDVDELVDDVDILVELLVELDVLEVLVDEEVLLVEVVVAELDNNRVMYTPVSRMATALSSSTPASSALTADSVQADDVSGFVSSNLDAGCSVTIRFLAFESLFVDPDRIRTLVADVTDVSSR